MPKQKLDTIPYLFVEKPILEQNHPDSKVEVPPYFQDAAKPDGTKIARYSYFDGIWRNNEPFVAKLRFVENYYTPFSTNVKCLHLFDEDTGTHYPMSIDKFEYMISRVTIKDAVIEETFHISRSHGRNSLELF